MKNASIQRIEKHNNYVQRLQFSEWAVNQLRKDPYFVVMIYLVTKTFIKNILGKQT